MCFLTLGAGSLAPWASRSALRRQAAGNSDRVAGDMFPWHLQPLLFARRDNGDEKARFYLHFMFLLLRGLTPRSL